MPLCLTKGRWGMKQLIFIYHKVGFLGNPNKEKLLLPRFIIKQKFATVFFKHKTWKERFQLDLKTFHIKSCQNFNWHWYKPPPPQWQKNQYQKEVNHSNPIFGFPLYPYQIATGALLGNVDAPIVVPFITVGAADPGIFCLQGICCPILTIAKHTDHAWHSSGERLGSFPQGGIFLWKKTSDGKFFGGHESFILPPEKLKGCLRCKLRQWMFLPGFSFLGSLLFAWHGHDACKAVLHQPCRLWWKGEKRNLCVGGVQNILQKYERVPGGFRAGLWVASK